MNVGRLDQMIRIIVGALLIIASLAGVIGAWGYIGIIPLLTGFFRWCPLYKLMGIQTCPLHESAKH